MTTLPLPSQTLAWLNHAADAGQRDAQALLHLIARADKGDQDVAVFVDSYSRTIAALCRRLEALERGATDLPAPAAPGPVEPAPAPARAGSADSPIPMVLIPSGSFLMGSPEDEPGRSEAEGPQREVTLGAFFMAQTPITQAQWRMVASWPRVALELRSDPSHFKGAQRPVEWVSWFEAMEFCDRLSQHTGRSYTLPSEAQWEYACRAGSTTPFHFGATLTPDLANYNGNHVYGNGPKGTYREQTTDVASFPANPWGLHDMHGNVWEWCLDEWHDSYEGAPSDGGTWADGRCPRLLRGGSWLNNPRYCRSAYRGNDHPDFRGIDIGFRVCCLPQD